MFSIWLSLLIVLSVKIIAATNLRCNEDINGSFQVIENCRACVIFIAPATKPTTSTTTTTILPRNIITSNIEPSIEELFLFDEKKRRRRHSVDTVIHQHCAREIDGPLYGYDQTHCYCNSNQCNSNIQRCIYEVTSKRHFACYHGSNSSQYPLEIRHKCRSCRILTEFNSMYHYECLTFGEREQNNRTHCTCQRPMCNQDVSTCQRFQQIPSHSRTNLVLDLLFNSTTSTIATTTTTPTTTKFTHTSTIKTTSTTITTTTTTTTTTKTPIISTTTPTPSSTTTTTTVITTTTSIITTTPITTTLSTIIESEEVSTENSKIIELTTTTNETTTSYIEIKHLKTVYIEVKNQAIYLSSNFILIFTLSQTFFSLFIYSM
jgi:hypothetical protein